MIPLRQRIYGALLFGFAVVFGFSIVFQAATEFLNWLGFQHRFLFPGGLGMALANPIQIVSVLTSLVFTSLVVAIIFFVVKSRPRRSNLLWDDDKPGQGDDQAP